MSAKSLPSRGEDIRMAIIRSSSIEGSSEDEADTDDDDRDENSSDVDIVGDPPMEYRN